MKSHFRSYYLLLLTIGLMPLACDRPPTSNLPTTSMTIGKKTYTLEIAAREADRDHGLMQRDSMPSDHGMIFVFPDRQMRNFWMKNTRIPLDIIFLDSDGSIVSIHHMEPYKLDNVPSDLPAQYAIELNAGQAGEAGVKFDDIVKLPDAVKHAKGDPQ
jgi:hypothetical protein